MKATLITGATGFLGWHIARKLLLDCCGSQAWAERMLAHVPFPDAEFLLGAADNAMGDATGVFLSGFGLGLG